MVNITDFLNNLLSLLDKYYPRKKKNQQLHQNGVLITDNNREVTSTQSLSANSTLITGLSTVATTGNYQDLTNTPTKLSDFNIDNNFTLNYNKITNTPTKLTDFNSTGFKMDYSNITNTPTKLTDFNSTDFKMDYSNLTNTPTKLTDFTNNLISIVETTFPVPFDGIDPTYTVGEIIIGNTSHKLYGKDTNTTYNADNNTLQLSESNTFSVKEGGITYNKINTNTIGTGSNQIAKGDHEHNNYLQINKVGYVNGEYYNNEIIPNKITQTITDLNIGAVGNKYNVSFKLNNLQTNQEIHINIPYSNLTRNGNEVSFTINTLQDIEIIISSYYSSTDNTIYTGAVYEVKYNP